MEHIKERHLKRNPKTSEFFTNVDVKKYVAWTMEQPEYVTPHPVHPRRTWYFRKCEEPIGRRGYDGRLCHWMAVLLCGKQLVTTYPVPHPNTMACVRNKKRH